MANRRCFQFLTRYLQSIKTLTSLSYTLAPSSTHAVNQTLTAKRNYHIFVNDFNVHPYSSPITGNFCSKHSDSDEDDDCDGESAGEDDPAGNQSADLSAEDKEKEAAEIGYKVIGSLGKSDRAFKCYEPVFAVVQIGSHQFKVSMGILFMQKG